MACYCATVLLCVPPCCNIQPQNVLVLCLSALPAMLLLLLLLFPAAPPRVLQGAVHTGLTKH